MAQPTVKTVQYVDPRIEPQPDPVYDYVIGPTQNQYYRIAASGKSNSSLTFNNLTTLGVDRAYLDTFEIELGIQIKFFVNDLDDRITDNILFPRTNMFTFQSFPFNTCCDEARVNINGGAFFSQPMCYIRAKERYMNQEALSRSYENICPVNRPELHYESGANYYFGQPPAEIAQGFAPVAVTGDNYIINGRGLPTRFGAGMYGYNLSSEGMKGSFNNSIIDLGDYNLQTGISSKFYRAAQYDTGGLKCVILNVTWREPIFVSPFSSRYDATYGRPLYNITSMDFAFNLMDLGNMIRLKNLDPTLFVNNYQIDITSAMLCYQVMTIPAILQKPLTTLVPYRRFVPFITDFDQQINSTGQAQAVIPPSGQKNVTISSGVYTFNEIPTAIWVFAAPVKATYQTNKMDKNIIDTGAIDYTDVNSLPSWDNNKLFGFLKHIDISMANTTQILNTATPVDLYRIAKANGCEDSYFSWGAGFNVLSKIAPGYDIAQMQEPESPYAQPTGAYTVTAPYYYGAGSVLRLKPGVDIIVPDIPLIPGANASNMVFQCTATFDIPPCSINNNKWALWLLFEYVGVAAITPGQCEITMNPLGSGDVMSVSPIMSATSEATEGKLEGSGFWDGVKRSARIARQIADSGVLSKILRCIPGADKNAIEWLEKKGLGESGCKRRRCEGGAVKGGAVIGTGLKDWI